MKTAQPTSVTSLAHFKSPQADQKDLPESLEPSPQIQQHDRFIRLMTVLDRVGIARSTLYQYMEAGIFPAQIKIGRASYWSEMEITAWMDEHKTHSRYTGER